jgi:hypothetical protein
MPPPSSGAVTLTPNAVPPPTYINGALTVSGKATSPSGVPTGSVSVQKNGVPAGTAPLDATGSFSLPETASGVPGVDVYTISYAPTGGVFQPATTTLNVPVTLPPTTFTIGAMPNPAPAGTPTLISGTVTAANGGIPTGTVTVRSFRPARLPRCCKVLALPRESLLRLALRVPAWPCLASVLVPCQQPPGARACTFCAQAWQHKPRRLL